jgi:hypothetical protein
MFCIREVEEGEVERPRREAVSDAHVLLLFLQEERPVGDVQRYQRRKLSENETCKSICLLQLRFTNIPYN